jgi:hypothetical protein
MYLQSDWRKVYRSRGDVRRDIGLVIPYEGFEGWIETNTDTVFVTYLEDGMKKLTREGLAVQSYYAIYVWNDPFARKQVAEYLGYPVVATPTGKVPTKEEMVKSKKRSELTPLLTFVSIHTRRKENVWR